MEGPWRRGSPGRPPSREDRIFPVPLLRLDPLRAQASKEKRIAWRRTERINDCLSSLNWLANTRCTNKEVGPVSSEIHSYVAQCVDEQSPPADLQSPEDAAKTVLRATAGYDAEPGHGGPATFDTDLLSLPPDMSAAPYADQLGCNEISTLLEGFVQCELRDAEEYQCMIDQGLEPRPYMDATLGSKRKTYVKFVCDLAKRGLMKWSTEPKEFCAVFFVPKKDKRIRMIIDARRANMRLKDPPGVKLCSTEAFSRIEVSADTAEVYMGTADVKDCFTVSRSGNSWHNSLLFLVFCLRGKRLFERRIQTLG